jgi:hypothetical protein
MNRPASLLATAALLVLLSPASRAWDYEGHRLVNQLALASLPANFPAFARTPAARERVAFLAGEPDRWRNTPDLALKHFNSPDHYLDIDDLPLYRLDPASLTPFRYEFAAQLAAARAARPHDFAPIDPAKDADRTRALVGFLPWTITEHYSKLKSTFSYLKALEEGGTPEEVSNAQQNTLYCMGVLGHFVGDGAQPLHTTKHYNGWVGDNPKNYTTNRTFHAWIDGGFLQRAGLRADSLLARVRPAKVLTAPTSPGLHTNVFPAVMSYLQEQFKLVEPLYDLEKRGQLAREGEVFTEAYDFLTGQMLKAGQMLGDLWLSAWHYAPPDNYLKSQLAKRKLQEASAPSP